jgi:endo-1,4-beta-xylanase
MLVLFCIVLANSSILSAQSVPLILEAESGVAGADFEEITENGLTYITAKTDRLEDGSSPGTEDKVTTYEVEFPALSRYDLYARVYVGAQTGDDDSFLIAKGLGEKDPLVAHDWIVVNQLAGAGYTQSSDFVVKNGAAASEVWKWVNISEMLNLSEPVTINVENELTQTFQIASREDGLRIDKFAFAAHDYFFTVSNLDHVEAGSTQDPFFEVGDFDPMATGNEKFLGNIYSSRQLPDFEKYWNQVTPENGGKWGTVEGTRDQFLWGAMDAAYELARENNFPFKQHVMVWGSQQPGWMEALSVEDQLDEIHEWFDTVSTRYPDIEIVEVVNEPLHAPPSYKEALGGDGETGWDWVITSFELARQYFPNAKLIMNDYNILNSRENIIKYREITDLLITRGLIDQLGVQGHAFTVNRLSSTSIKRSLDSLAKTGLPIYVTELDIDGPTDRTQLDRYQEVFPAIWEHPAVKGVTLWGWRPGLWRNEEKAFLVNSIGEERPALQWLREYVIFTTTGDPIAFDYVLGASSNKEFIVYPNPAFDGQLTITSRLDRGYYEVLDLDGREVISRRILRDENAVTLTKGIYLLRLFNEDRLVKTEKLIIY